MTDAPDDLYAVLGLSRDASQAEIGAAFRALLRHYHPDTRAAGTQDAALDATLQLVLTAYQTLRDPARRSAYDKRSSRPAPTNSRARPIRVTRTRPADDPPLRVGPVYWSPGR